MTSVIVKKQYSFRNQPFYRLFGVQAAVVEPNPEARALFSSSLGAVHIEVQQFESIAELLEALSAPHEFEVIVVNPEQHLVSQLTQIKIAVPHIPVITISKMMPETQLDGIMKAGVAMHINRDLTTPRDLLIAIEQVVAGE